MHIDSRTFGDITILDLTGKLTIDDGASMLRDRVARLVAQGDRKLVLNLAHVPYVDSGGLGELVRCSLIANRTASSTTGLLGHGELHPQLLLITSAPLDAA